MTIEINKRHVAISEAMQKHWSIPINHAQTILNQINSGMYSRFFEGKKDLVCVDIGANVGLVSLYMEPFCKELYCMEPTPSHFALLKELLGEKANVHLSQSALTEKNETVIFATGHSTENKVTSAEGYGSHKINVQGLNLSTYLNVSGADRNVIDFLKCDIEGGEMKALTLDELKKVKGKVKCFFVEVHPAYNGGMDENREELINRFTKAGFRTELIDYQTFIATS